MGRLRRSRHHLKDKSIKKVYRLSNRTKGMAAPVPPIVTMSHLLLRHGPALERAAGEPHG